MSKKKFTYGLESLFGDNEPYREEAVVTESGGDEAKAEANAKKAGGKNFTADLESLFQDALRETVEDQVEKIKKSGSVEDNAIEQKRSAPRTLSGIDALIRRTSDYDETSTDYKPTKRVTFVFENQKIIKLKNIARQERAYLKDILNDIITAYIEDYENNKGNLE